MDISALREAGLTEGEIKVYLALLEIGSSTTGPIVDKSNVSRSIVYQILDNLLEKGLVGFIIKEKTRYYSAGDPSKILEYIDRREKELLANKIKVEQLLPELMLKQTLTTKSSATFYVGFEGIRTVHENTYKHLSIGDEYLYLGIPKEQPSAQHAYWQKDHKRRTKAGIKCRLLFNCDSEKEILENRNSFEDCDARYMPTDIITPSFFLIYKDTVVIMTQYPKSIAVEIVNQDVADSFKAYFEAFWKQSKKI